MSWSGLTSGLCVSAVIHVLFLLVAAHIFFGFGFGGAGKAGDEGPIGVATVTEGELAELGGASISVDAPGVSVSETAAVTVDSTLELSDLTAAADSTAGLGEIGAGLGGASDIGTGDGGLGAGGSGGGGGASFFGVEAQGSRFVYIVDTSGSMTVGSKIQSLRTELARSVNDLLGNSHFLIVPFSTDAAPLGGKVAWYEATDRNKRATGREIEVLPADGGTNPSPAFMIAFSLKPRPDAIYFMTDGEFSPTVVDEIAALNRKADIRIHCICFVSKGSEEQMKQIAKQSGGTYTFVPGIGGP